MKILVYRKSDEEPRLEEVKNELEDLQQLVEGYIQAVPISRDYILVCDEEGKIKSKQVVRYCYPLLDAICGTFFVCKSDEEGNFVGIDVTDIEKIQRYFAV